ncbi:hypothetical protein GFL18_27420 [Rhizobium leguminosarum bv. viciae]|nr:hypothetical protein [Rhizobium leguminosarum bv. viciae]
MRWAQGLPPKRHTAASFCSMFDQMVKIMPIAASGIADLPLIRLPAPTGVEPRVSTRPSDPRSRGEGDMPRPLDSLFSPAGRRCP